MLFLNILENETFLIAAEMLFIVTGSMLLGILLAYYYWGGNKTVAADLSSSLEQERKNAEELRDQIRQISDLRAQLQSDINELTLKSNSQIKTIYDQQQYIFSHETEHKNQKAVIDGLNATIDSYQHRLRIIEEELEKARTPEPKTKKPTIPAIRANYEHVSILLGRQVTENDLTLIVGIGPKTSALLQANGIDDWDKLAAASPKVLKVMLLEAGGVYKALDPTHWPKQASMAAQGEWRKLRVFQEALRKSE
jgi:predicted flap endonuclease-1-like 5' DNA nuclease